MAKRTKTYNQTVPMARKHVLFLEYGFTGAPVDEYDFFPKAVMCCAKAGAKEISPARRSYALGLMAMMQCPGELEVLLECRY